MLKENNISFLHIFFGSFNFFPPFLVCATACRVLVPQLGIESVSPAVMHGILTIRLPGKSLLESFDGTEV